MRIRRALREGIRQAAWSTRPSTRLECLGDGRGGRDAPLRRPPLGGAANAHQTSRTEARHLLERRCVDHDARIPSEPARHVDIRPLGDRDLRRALQRLPLHRLGSENGFYLVAWEDEEPIGHAHVALTEAPEVQDVFVLPDRRRRGIATQLTRAAEYDVAARGHDRLTLTVGADNAAAQALYRDLGYADGGIPPRRVQGTVHVRTGPIEVDDVLLTWERRLGPPALLLHGGPGLVGDYLAPLAAELAPLFAVAGYHQGRHTEIDAYVAEAAEHLARPAWLVGHSWGGRLALHVAADHAEQVLGVVLLGSLGAVGDGSYAEAVATLVRRLATPARSFAEVWPAYFAEPALAPPAPAIDFDEEVSAPTIASVTARASALVAALRSFDKQVLFVHDTHDHIPLSAVTETAALLPDAQVRVLEGVGHFPWLERPGCVAHAIAETVDLDPARSS